MKLRTEDGLELDLDVNILRIALKRYIVSEGHRYDDVSDYDERARLVSVELMRIIAAVHLLDAVEEIIFEQERRALRQEVKDADEISEAARLSLGKQARRSKKVREENAKGSVSTDPVYESMVAFFRPLAVGAAFVVVILLSYNLLRSDRVTLAAAFAEPQVTLEEAYDPFLYFEME